MSRAAKPERQRAILELVRRRPIRTQDELVGALAARHLEATQATVSRDIRELGLLRVADAAGARYVASATEVDDPAAVAGSRLRGVVRDHVRSVEFIEHIGVLRGRPSTAPLVAAAVDAARLPEVAGTVAGDDTVLLVARSRAAAARLRRLFDGILGGGG